MSICETCGYNSSWDDDSVLWNPMIFSEGDSESPAASLRAALEEIDTELSRFQAFSARYIATLALLDAVTYPVLSLPTEITSRIFVECLPTHGYVRPSVRRAPLLLMRVCRQWEGITLETSELWRSLEMDCLKSSNGKPVLPRGVLNTWFSRAQAHTLSLTLDFPPHARSVQISDDASWAEHIDLSAIQPRLMRLDMLRVETWEPICLNAPLPLLQCLSASFLDTEIEHVLKNAPLLTKLHWTRFSISMQPPDFRHFASTTLTTLDITSSGISDTEFIAILHNFPSLADLTCVLDLRDVGHRTPLLFLNLLSLRLRNSSLAQVSPIHALKLLTLPHIQRLGCSSYLDPNVVLPFLSRSACAIRELEWDIDETNDIWRHREIMQAVETLRVTVHCKISRFLPLIDPESNAYRQLLPQLRHITVDYDCYDTYGFLLDHTRISAILDVASRRRRANTGTAQLESFHLVLRDSTEWDSWSAIFAAQLRHLISSGLDFTVALGDGTAIWPEGSQI
ncbi:hypothetical protein B0H13DRAFT_2054967 [Mycena leptocephala]|nr:hypothetical protein B0H13DRAFT_2054967 [Mycena leptocephala]